MNCSNIFKFEIYTNKINRKKEKGILPQILKNGIQITEWHGRTPPRGHTSCCNSRKMTSTACLIFSLASIQQIYQKMIQKIVLQTIEEKKEKSINSAKAHIHKNCYLFYFVLEKKEEENW